MKTTAIRVQDELEKLTTECEWVYLWTAASLIYFGENEHAIDKTHKVAVRRAANALCKTGRFYLDQVRTKAETVDIDGVAYKIHYEGVALCAGVAPPTAVSNMQSSAVARHQRIADEVGWSLATFYRHIKYLQTPNGLRYDITPVEWERGDLVWNSNKNDWVYKSWRAIRAERKAKRDADSKAKKLQQFLEHLSIQA